MASLLARNTELDAAGLTLPTEAESAERLDRGVRRWRPRSPRRATELDKGAEAARLAAARREALEARVASLRTSGGSEEAAETRRLRTDDTEAARLAEAAAAEELRRRLARSDAELTAMTLSLEAARAGGGDADQARRGGSGGERARRATNDGAERGREAGGGARAGQGAARRAGAGLDGGPAAGGAPEPADGAAAPPARRPAGRWSATPTRKDGTPGADREARARPERGAGPGALAEKRLRRAGRGREASGWRRRPGPARYRSEFFGSCATCSPRARGCRWSATASCSRRRCCSRSVRRRCRPRARRRSRG